MLADFINAYIETALWLSNDESDESGGEPLGRNYGIGDIAPVAMIAIRAACQSFVEANRDELEASKLADSRAGRDFWLNRNGHGTGFWDEYMDSSRADDACERLSAACKVWGEVDLYLGDDGLIYHG